MTWILLYLLCGFITTIVCIKLDLCDQEDPGGTPVLVVFIFWWMFTFIFGCVGLWLGSEWLFHWIADKIKLPNIKISFRGDK